VSAPRGRLLLTCEHAGNRVPARHAPLFRGADAVLRTHRGWDIGALALAKRLARRLGAPLLHTTVTRLLVDHNRSLGNRRTLFSEFVRGLDPAEKQRILDRHYLPHRTRVRAAVARSAARGDRVIHVAVHSFTPALRGVRRNADLGLLYDPGRPGELALARRWRAALREAAPGLRVRMNYPYRGTSDGIQTELRRRFGARDYVGLEIEVNQKHLEPGARTRAGVVRAVEASLARLFPPVRRRSRMRLVVLFVLLAAFTGAGGAGAGSVERVNVAKLGRLPAFSHATRSGGLVFASGTLGTRGDSLELVAGGVGPQTSQALANLATIFAASGARLADALQCTVYLTDMARFGEMNEAWLAVFGERPPARTTVGVLALALGAAVEIDCVAAATGSAGGRSAPRRRSARPPPRASRAGADRPRGRTSG
jgi:predicted N-formylglutamate amidohydrolase